MTTNFDRRRAQQSREIAERGFTVDHVLPEPVGDTVRPGYSYTTGLSTADIPELIIIGLNPSIANSALIEVAARLRQARDDSTAPRVPIETELLDVFKGTRAILLPAPNLRASKLALGAANFAQANATELSYLQLVWPDSKGNFPWEPQASLGFAEQQPILQSPYLRVTPS